MSGSGHAWLGLSRDGRHDHGMGSSVGLREMGRPDKSGSGLFTYPGYVTVAPEMKSKLPHSALRQFVLTLLLLFSALPSIQAVFACDLMGGKMQTVCCCKGHQGAAGCEKGGGCSIHRAASASSCCKVSYLYQPETNANAVPASQSFQPLLSDALQHLPALLSSSPAHAVPVSLQSGLYSNLPPPWRPGTQTYLLTHRLRI